jgi:transposase-like protein
VASEAVQQAKELLEKRLAELDAERQQVQHALSSLGRGSGRRPGAASPRRTSTRRRSGGKRARRGQREAEFLSQVKSAPGAKISEIAKTMGVAPQQLYPIARRLSDSGQVARKGDGFHVASK